MGSVYITKHENGGTITTEDYWRLSGGNHAPFIYMKTINVIIIIFFPPKGDRGISHISPLSGISGLSVFLPLFYISSFVLLPSLVAISVLSFSAFDPFSKLLFPLTERWALLCGSYFGGMFFLAVRR